MVQADAHKHSHAQREEGFFFMEAQLRTDPLIQSEENQHASGTKNCLNLLTAGERTHTCAQHKAKSTDTDTLKATVANSHTQLYQQICREIHGSMCADIPKYTVSCILCFKRFISFKKSTCLGSKKSCQQPLNSETPSEGVNTKETACVFTPHLQIIMCIYKNIHLMTVCSETVLFTYYLVISLR